MSCILKMSFFGICFLLYFANEVVERLFRSVLLTTNISLYVPKCAEETSDSYFRCYQQNSFTLPLFCWLLSLAGYIASLNTNNLTHACIFQALSCWFRLPVKRTNFRCAFKHFLPQSSSKRLFHDTSGGTFRIIIAYQESIIASFEDIWQSKLSQNADINVDHDNLRTVLLQTPNTSHSYPF